MNHHLRRCGFRIDAKYRCGMAQDHVPTNIHGLKMTDEEWAEYERAGRWDTPAAAQQVAP